MIYRIIPDLKHPENIYFVNAVDEQDALMTLTELNIGLFVGRIIDTGFSPKGHHLIVSSKKRDQDTKELREQKVPTVEAKDAERIDFDAYGKVQAAAIIAGNAFIPVDEESVQDVRNLLRDSIRLQKVSEQRAEDAVLHAQFTQKQSERAKERVERVQEYLTLALRDIAEKEARA